MLTLWHSRRPLKSSAVEEFLVCSSLSLSDDWSLEVERMEAKVTVLTLKVTATIGEQQTCLK
jgi:hypothetical protein